MERKAVKIYTAPDNLQAEMILEVLGKNGIPGYKRDLGAAGIMSAQLWIGENRKRIFTLHTAGIKYSAIILPVLRKEVIVAVCTVLVGGIVVYSIRHPEPLLLLLSSAVLFLMYVLLNFVGYIFFSKREFLQMSFRRE